MTLNAGTAYVDVLPRIAAGFGKNIDDGIRGDVEKSGENAGNAIGTTIKRIALAAAGAFALDKVKDFVSGTISAASDLNETVSKSQVIFGSHAAEMDKWSRTSSTALGPSRKAALDAASGFGDMFSQIGFTGGQAAGMSKDVVQLATDLGSFNNLDTNDVLDMISGSLRGEYDSLQRVIPNISAARVQQEAMAATGKKNADQLTAQEKAAATLAIIHKDGARAAGDFARTSGGLANQQRILGARMENLKASIGQVLLPVMVKLTSFVSGALGPGLERVSAIGKQVFDVLFKGDFTGGPFAEDSGFIDTLFNIRDAMQRLAGMARQVFDVLFKGDFTGGPFEEDSPFIGGVFRARELIGQLVDFVQNNMTVVLGGLGAVVLAVVVPAFVSWAIAAGTAAIATIVAAAPVIALVAAIGLLVGAFIYGYEHFAVFRDVVDAVASYVTGQIAHFVGWWETIWPQVSEAVTHVTNVIVVVVKAFIAVVMAAWGLFGDDLIKIASAVWGEIRAVIDFVVNTIAGIIRLVLAIINGDWGKAWQAVKDIFGGAWDFIVATAKNVLTLLSGIFGAAFDLLRLIVRVGLDAVIGFFKDLPGNFVKALEGLGRLIGDFVHWELTTAWHLAVLAFDAAIDFFQKLPGRLIGAAGDLAGIVGRWLRGQFDDAFQRAVDATESLIGWVSGLPGRITRAAAGMFDGIRDAFKGAINWIIDRWNGLEFKIPGFDPPGPGPTFPGFTLGMPDIPRLASGGILRGLGIVGEEGPELIDTGNTRARVFPNELLASLVGRVEKHYHLELSGTAYEPVDVTEQFHRMELLELPT